MYSLPLTTPRVFLSANLKGGYKAIVIMKSLPTVLCFAAFSFLLFAKTVETGCCSHEFCAFLCCELLYLHNPSGAEEAVTFMPASLQVLQRSPRSLKAMWSMLVKVWLKPAKPLSQESW